MADGARACRERAVDGAVVLELRSQTCAARVERGCVGRDGTPRVKGTQHTRCLGVVFGSLNGGDWETGRKLARKGAMKPGEQAAFEVQFCKQTSNRDAIITLYLDGHSSWPPIAHSKSLSGAGALEP
jgi:hypothetical protein